MLDQLANTGRGEASRRDARRSSWSVSRDALVGGGAGGLVVGAVVAGLILDLHPHLAPGLGQRGWLLGELMALYGVLGLLLGGLAAIAFGAVDRLAQRSRLRGWLAATTVGTVTLAPILYAALLPDLGLLPGFLAELLPQNLLLRGAFVAMSAAALSAAFVAGRAAAGRRMTGGPAWRLGAFVAIGAVIAISVAWALSTGGRPAPVGEAPAALEDPARAPAEPRKRPLPVVLLMIDGADLDDVILPMVEDGELPTFARLMRQGTWGFLESSRPTLSPILWTTVATGKPVEDHGIRDFDYFRFPGFGLPIDRFPRYSGLEEGLFAGLEALPGAAFLHAPYTSDLRRSKALWEIAGEHHPVGVYRWLITWPAEKVRGFLVSGGVFAGPGRWNPRVRGWLRDLREQAPGVLETFDSYPAELGIDGLRVPRRVGDRQLEPYLAGPATPAGALDRDDPRLQLIARGLMDPTLAELPALMKRYRPRLTMASFYTVDAFQHRFFEERRDGGTFAGVIAERYRLTDRKLGRFLRGLDEKTHVIVISDHGFDFETGDHWQAPPGIFFARGPAFRKALRIDELGLQDIAPLGLYLLGLPLPEDMPGTGTAAYRRAVRPRYLSRHPATTIATYEDRPRRAPAIESALDEALKKQLESLGYLH